MKYVHSKYYLDKNADDNVRYLDAPKQINSENGYSSIMLL